MFITNDPDENYLLNYKPKLAELKNLSNIWKQRALSLKGKIIIINTLALTPLIYVASIIDIPKNAITKINIIQQFIWNGKTSKIAQSILIQSIEHGGLKLCHFETKSKVLKLSCVNPTHANWKLLTKYFYNCNNLNMFFSASHKLLCDHKIPPFYNDMHMLFMKYFELDPVNLRSFSYFHK